MPEPKPCTICATCTFRVRQVVSRVPSGLSARCKREALSLKDSENHIYMQAEMRQGLSYFHSTIFTSLPLFYRRIDTALKQVHLQCLTPYRGSCQTQH